MNITSDMYIEFGKYAFEDSCEYRVFASDSQVKIYFFMNKCSQFYSHNKYKIFNEIFPRLWNNCLWKIASQLRKDLTTSKCVATKVIVTCLLSLNGFLHLKCMLNVISAIVLIWLWYENYMIVMRKNALKKQRWIMKTKR